MIEPWTEGWFDSHMRQTKTQLSILQDGPNKKFRWKVETLHTLEIGIDITHYTSSFSVWLTVVFSEQVKYML